MIDVVRRYRIRPSGGAGPQGAARLAMTAADATSSRSAQSNTMIEIDVRPVPDEPPPWFRGVLCWHHLYGWPALRDMAALERWLGISDGRWLLYIAARATPGAA